MGTQIKKRNAFDLRWTLEKKDAVYLFSSCIAQLFLWCINPGTIDMYKYIMAGVSFCFITLFLRNIWVQTDPDVRSRLVFRVLLFTIAFNASVVIIGKMVGGLIAFAFGVVFIIAFWKISPLSAEEHH